MTKIIFIIGAPCTGKSTYIQKNFLDKSQYYILDVALESKKLFGNYEAIEDDDKSLEMFNSINHDALMALFDGLDLVVEYCTDGFDDDLYGLIKEARKLGILIEVIVLDVEADLAWERNQKAKENPDYYSSFHIKWDTMEILQGVLESYEMNIDFEEICEVGGEGGSIKFFRKGGKEKDEFFYMTNEEALYEFEFEKMEGVNYVKVFDNFQDAFDSLQKDYPIFSLYPLKVSDRYKIEIREAFQKHLKVRDRESHLGDWELFLN